MTNTDHDVNALVDLATAHKDQWGDSCHHALAKEVVRLRQNTEHDISRMSQADTVIKSQAEEIVRLREELAATKRLIENASKNTAADAWGLGEKQSG